MATEVFKRPSMQMIPRKDAKRAKLDEGQLVLAQLDDQNKPNQRTSNLMGPIMLLTGHEGEIYCGKFSYDGSCLATSGYDMKILLWNVYEECDNFSHLSGHTGAVMDLHFSADSEHLYSCSSDKTVRVWNMETGACIRKLKAHTDIVNSCYPARRGPELIVSGSDDGSIIVHDIRKKEPAFRAQNVNDFQVTAISFSDSSEQIISGGIENVIKIWDMRKNQVVHFLAGHADTVTGISLNKEGTHIVSNSMDCTARIWDVRPFSSGQRCVKTLTGHQHNFEKNLLKCAWSPDGRRVTCGSSDRFTYVWDVTSKNIVYKLPGHQGSVNAVDFHPSEPILLSAGSDKRVFLGELS